MENVEMIQNVHILLDIYASYCTFIDVISFNPRYNFIKYFSHNKTTLPL